MGYLMKKTRHQTFVDELRKQLTGDSVQRSDFPKKQGSSDDSGESRREDILKDIERKFDELFGNLDDDDG